MERLARSNSLVSLFSDSDDILVRIKSRVDDSRHPIIAILCAASDLKTTTVVDCRSRHHFAALEQSGLAWALQFSNLPLQKPYGIIMNGKKHEMTLLSCPSRGTTAKASSVLQKNSKLYGPLNALDLENTTTCWNSDGSPSGKQSSHLIINFGRLVEPKELKIQYQAGFVAESLTVFWLDGSSSWKPLTEEEMDDDHDLQPVALSENDSGLQTTSLKIVFDECTDFYSRVTVYQLQVWGNEVEN